MLAAIDAAQHTAVLSTYLFRADVAGRAFIGALDRANRRGVQVRVLIDSIGSGYFLSQAYWHMRRRGIKVVRFMHSPLPWRMPFLNLRTHKKLLVIDGRVAFMGGLNIGRKSKEDVAQKAFFGLFAPDAAIEEGGDSGDTVVDGASAPSARFDPNTLAGLLAQVEFAQG